MSPAKPPTMSGDLTLVTCHRQQPEYPSSQKKWGSSTPLRGHFGAIQSFFWTHLSRSTSVLRVVTSVSNVGAVLSRENSLVALLPLMGFVGLVLFVITGWTGPDKKTPVVESAGWGLHEHSPQKEPRAGR